MNLYSAADYDIVTPMRTLSYIYAHGEAENFMRHDVLLVLPPTISPEPGLHIVTLNNPHGETKQAIMFVWKVESVSSRGLVIFGDDLESVRQCCSIFGKPFISLVG
jgi:hypothetical protein